MHRASGLHGRGDLVAGMTLQPLLRTALPAFVVTFLALLAWNPKNNGAMAAGGSSAESGSNSAADSSHQRSKYKSADIAGGLLGFQSIVLWPLAEKSKLEIGR